MRVGYRLSNRGFVVFLSEEEARELGAALTQAAERRRDKSVWREMAEKVKEAVWDT